MPRRTDLPRPVSGFSLLEAVIAVAIMAIMAGAAVPMMMRALTQQREQRTRSDVKVAYEALVGARDRNVPNLVVDVGFQPPALLADLRFLTTRNPGAIYRNGNVPGQFPTTDLATGFTWGWNGPYWTGSVQAQAGTNGIPTDAWGRLFRWQANQVQSAGADGQFGTADDLNYPPVPPIVAPGLASLQVTIERSVPLSPPPVLSATYNVVISYVRQQVFQRRYLLGSLTFPASNSSTVPAAPATPYSLPSGPVLVEVMTASGNQSQAIALAPGEKRILLFRFNN